MNDLEVGAPLYCHTKPECAKVHSRVTIPARLTMHKGQLNSWSILTKESYHTVETYSALRKMAKDTFGGRSSTSNIDGEREKGNREQKEGKRRERKGREGEERRRGKELTINYKSGLVFCSGVFLQ